MATEEKNGKGNEVVKDGLKVHGIDNVSGLVSDKSVSIVIVKK